MRLVSRRKLWLLLLALLLSTLACNRAYALVGMATETAFPPAAAGTTAIPAPQTETVTPAPAPQSETCLENEVWHPDEGLCFIEDDATLDAILPDYYARIKADLNVYQNPADSITPDSETVLTSYQVIDNQIRYPEDQPISQKLRPLQTDRAKHAALWHYFAAIIPPDARPEVTEFNIFTDGTDDTLAYVEQTLDDPTHWAVNIDIQDSQDFGDLTLTLVHEYGHLLTLNANQVPPNLDVFNNPDDDDIYIQAEYACPTYFPGEGCATADSYLYQFYQRFWADIYDEWLDVNNIADDDAYYQALDDFYYKYQDRFVSDYAATNPEEDIAESWAYFVLRPKPDGDRIADQKLRFFYEYPELVRLRREIIARLYSRMMRLNE